MNRISIELNDYDYGKLMDFVNDNGANLDEFIRIAIHEKIELELEKQRIKIPNQRFMSESSFDQQDALEELRFLRNVLIRPALSFE